MQQDYPIAGEDGQTICAVYQTEWTPGDKGTEVEEYYFDRMNAVLDEEPAFATFVGDRHIGEVSSCDQAREFMRLRNEWLDSQPSLTQPPPNESGKSADVPVDKIAYYDSGLVPYPYGPSVQINTWAGSPWDWSGACSGTLVGPYALITSAHCFYAGGSRPVTVRAFNGTCLRPIAGLCLPDDADVYANATVYRYPTYLGSGDTSHDLAVVIYSSNWPSPFDDPGVWMRMGGTPAWVGQQVWYLGWGATCDSCSDGNQSRRSNAAVTVESSNSGYWIQWPGQYETRPCRGDSGGISLYSRSTGAVNVGIPSNWSGGGGNCPDGGDTVRFTHPGPLMPWVDTLTGVWCHTVTDGGFTWWQCWN